MKKIFQSFASLPQERRSIIKVAFFVELLIASSVLLSVRIFSLDPAHGPSLVEGLVYPLFNFSIYAFLFVTLYNWKLFSVVANRAEEIDSSLEVNQMALAEAEAELVKVRTRLEKINVEKDSIVSELRQEGEREASAIIGSISGKVEKIKDDSRRQVENLAARAERDFRREIVLGATSVARGMLDKKLTSEVDREFRLGSLRRIFS